MPCAGNPLWLWRTLNLELIQYLSALEDRKQR